ncbi:hypothetical protein Hypma_003172, partial [Hypsizygus marmoreus]
SANPKVRHFSLRKAIEGLLEVIAQSRVSIHSLNLPQGRVVNGVQLNLRCPIRFFKLEIIQAQVGHISEVPCKSHEVFVTDYVEMTSTSCGSVV